MQFPNATTKWLPKTPLPSPIPGPLSTLFSPASKRENPHQGTINPATLPHPPPPSKFQSHPQHKKPKPGQERERFYLQLCHIGWSVLLPWWVKLGERGRRIFFVLRIHRHRYVYVWINSPFKGRVEYPSLAISKPSQPRSPPWLARNTI